MGLEDFSFTGGASSGVYEQVELAWAAAPNTGGQAMTNNVPLTITLDTLLHPSSAPSWLVSGPTSNQFELAASLYQVNSFIHYRNSAGNTAAFIAYLYNVTDSTRIRSRPPSGLAPEMGIVDLAQRFEISATKTFDVRAMSTAPTGTTFLDNGSRAQVFTDTTAGLDLRNTIIITNLNNPL